MSFDLSRLEEVVSEHYGNLPHPDIPGGGVKVKDYEGFVRVAARLSGQQKPEAMAVANAHAALSAAGVSPADFERLWDVAQPLTQRLLERNPSIQEIHQLSQQGATPGHVHEYYSGHPHPDYPEVRVGDFATAWHQAEPIARHFLSRAPAPREVARFAAAKYSADDIVQHYNPESGW